MPHLLVDLALQRCLYFQSHVAQLRENVAHVGLLGVVQLLHGPVNPQPVELGLIAVDYAHALPDEILPPEIEVHQALQLLLRLALVHYVILLLLFRPHRSLEQVFLEGEHVQQEVLARVVDEMRQVLAQELPVDEVGSLEGPFAEELLEDGGPLVFDDLMKGLVRLAKTCALRKLTPWSRKTEVRGAIRGRKGSA